MAKGQPVPLSGPNSTMVDPRPYYDRLYRWLKTDDLPSTLPDKQWEDYKRAFGKVYEREEEQRRRGIFEQNLAGYAELNALEPLAHYGPTAFSDLTAEESSKRLRGYRPSGITAQEAKLEVATSIQAPTSRDWTGIATSPIKDQGSCGGCWAESAIEQVESDAMRQHNWTGVLSTQELIDCTRKGEGSWEGGCGGGDPIPGYKVLQALGGVASGYEYKFEGRDARCKIDKYKKYVKVESYHSVGKMDEVAMKRYVGSTGPLSVCVDAHSWSGYTGGIKTTCGNITDHCVQVVGYGTHAGTDYWKVRNSWGAEWGELGFMRLQMGRNLCNIAQNPTATSVVATAPAPVPSPSPACSDRPLDWRSSEGDPCSICRFLSQSCLQLLPCVLPVERSLADETVCPQMT